MWDRENTTFPQRRHLWASYVPCNKDGNNKFSSLLVYFLIFEMAKKVVPRSRVPGGRGKRVVTVNPSTVLHRAQKPKRKTSTGKKIWRGIKKYGPGLVAGALTGAGIAAAMYHRNDPIPVSDVLMGTGLPPAYMDVGWPKSPLVGRPLSSY